MEIEAKQQAMRASKRSVQGSYIQYLSTTMPLNQVKDSYKLFSEFMWKKIIKVLLTLQNKDTNKLNHLKFIFYRFCRRKI